MLLLMLLLRQDFEGFAAPCSGKILHGNDKLSPCHPTIVIEEPDFTKGFANGCRTPVAKCVNGLHKDLRRLAVGIEPKHGQEVQLEFVDATVFAKPGSFLRASDRWREKSQGKILPAEK